jgi:hypothetical protein
MANFTTDLDEAESRDAASKSFNRIDEWRIKDGETHYLRLIMNGAVPMDVHQYVPTKDKPAECSWPKWPEQMWAVCPRDQAFRLTDEAGNPIDGYEEGYGECYIHDHYAGRKGKYGKDMGVPVVVSYGLAVPRKVVLDPVTAKPVGLADDTFEFRASSGDIVRLPRIVIVAQKYSQFWGAVKATQFLPPFSMCDKDFKITRQENDLKVTALDRTPDHQPGTASWKRYEQAIELLDASVEKYLTEHASRNHYVKFFIPGELPEGGYGGGGSDDDEDGDKKAKGGAPTTATHPEVPADEMEAFRDSLTKRAPAASADVTPTAV